MKKLFLLFLLILLIQLFGYAQITFRDVPPNHPAYDSVYNIVNIYKLMSGYEDNTFRGQENISRFQFSGMLSAALAYLERVSGRNLIAKKITTQKFEDVPDDHWAAKSVNDVVNRYQVMGGYDDQTFRGEKPLSRLELAVILGKIIFRIEGAEKYTINPYFEDVNRKNWAFKYVQKLVDLRLIAGGGRFLGEEPVTRYEGALAMDMFLQKLAPMLQTKLPTEIKSAMVYQEVPMAVEVRWGGVFESASQTENWLVYGLGLNTWRAVNFFGRNMIWDLGVQYSTNKMVYLDSTNPYSYLLLWENRYLVKLMGNFLLSPQLAVTLGLEYLSLNNSFSPSSYTGLAFGTIIKLPLPGGLSPDIKVTYATPWSKLEQVNSRLGAPHGRIFVEIAHDFPLLGAVPQLTYDFEDLLMGENNYARTYHTLGLRFKL